MGHFESLESASEIHAEQKMWAHGVIRGFTAPFHNQQLYYMSKRETVKYLTDVETDGALFPIFDCSR